MTKTKQNKRLLYLVALVIMIALMSIACKNKATAPSFSEDSSEEVVKPEGPTTPEEPKPTVGTFSKYAGTYEGNNKYNDGKGEGYYIHKAVLDGDNVKIYKVYTDSKKEALWRNANSVNGTTTVKDWEQFTLAISGNKIVLHFPNSQQITVWKK